jgi:hypothetical protein
MMRCQPLTTGHRARATLFPCQSGREMVIDTPSARRRMTPSRPKLAEEFRRGCSSGPSTRTVGAARARLPRPCPVCYLGRAALMAGILIRSACSG